MYGSKRSIIPYTCVINGNGSMLENKQNVVDENSMINSKIDNSHVCEIEKTKNKLV